MGRKVTENHKIVEQCVQGAAEDLIKEQNAMEEFVLGEIEETQSESNISSEIIEETQLESNMNSEIIEKDKIKNETIKDNVENVEILEDLIKKEKEQQEKLFEGTVMLTGAATYLDSGIRYFKNKPIKVIDKKVYKQLLKTGLFVCLSL